jgi:hypothetical protein
VAGQTPLKFATGTLVATAEAGAVEYDGTVGYFTQNANCRGVMMAEQIGVSNATLTLTSQIAAQPLFKTSVSTNGALTLPVGTFEFECSYALSAMSATNGSFGFSFGGTATITQGWEAAAIKNTLATASTGYQTYNTAANTSLTANSTATTGYARITGIIRVTVAGTIIPQVSLTVAAAAVVAVGSYFKIRQVGSSTVTKVGNWS